MFTPLLQSQATGSFSGTVSDNSGAVVAGAKVTVTSQATNVSREATTDDTGHYLVPLLGVANYTLRVEAAGFKPAGAKDVRLQLDEHRELDFKVVPASVSTSVEVNATEVAVQTTNATLGQVITAQQVADLPLNGRDFVQLATLTPGTTQETNPQSFFNAGPSSEVSARGTFSLSVGGSRVQSTDWLFDGNDNNELTAGGIAILPSIDAIQEFKVLTYNYSAEYGTRAGPTVLVTTKSGSNQYHGSLFEYFRNTSLDAKSYFASEKEKFNLNQFGGAIGGPIRKDKTFFFLDYQAKMQRHGIPFVGLIPTQAMMAGNFSQDPFGVARPGQFNGSSNADGFIDLVNPYANGNTGGPFLCNPAGATLVPIAPNADGSQTPSGGSVNCNIIPAGLIQSAGQSMINLYPQSNANNASSGYNFTSVPVRKLNEGEFDIRVDHNFSSKDSVFGRFSYDQATSFVPGGSPGYAEAGAFASTQSITNHGRNAMISETHIFSPTNINQFTFGFNRIFNIILSFGNGQCEAQKIGILGADLNSACGAQPAGIVNQSTKDCMSCGLSSMQFLTGYWSLGDRGYAPSQGGTNVFSIADSFDMIRGKHDVRVGVGIRANQLNVRSNAFQDGFFLMGDAFTAVGNGTYSGDPEADLLLGQFGGAIHDQTYDGATTGRRWKMYRPYVQDDWRATPNLTLNLGLAWSLVTPVTEAHNRMANFDFQTGKYLVAGPAVAGCTTCVQSNGAAGVQFDKTALEPRIGLAWKVLGSQKTALRAGYAIFHDGSWSQGDQGLWLNPPYLAESDNFSGLSPFQSLGTVTCGFLSQGCGVGAAFLPFIPPPLNPDTFQGTRLYQNLNFKQGMVQQFNVNVEQQLPGDIVLTAGYAGSRGHHILVSGVNVNLGSPSACGVVSGYTLGCGPGGTALAAPYGPFTIVGNFNDAGNATYNSFQIKAETKSARHGLYALVGYTYSHTYDSGMADNLGTTPGATYWPLPNTQKADWAHSQINLDNQFTASVIYDLPFGRGKAFGSNWGGPANVIFGNWQATVIQKITSGFPLFVVNSNNASGVFFQWNGNGLNRPDEVGDPNRAGPVAANPGCTAPSQVHTIQNWFNPCAFVAAPAGELGTANRAPVNGPDFVNTDFSLIKQFKIGERVGMEFRTEFFNLFNHAQFFLPGSPLTTMQDLNSATSFGKITQTVNNPRLIQFALRLTF
ncbi:MAG: carboxypeptidase-like regulatory domain-containing protein [Candidatus Sulfotelmatobacter sp.]